MSPVGTDTKSTPVTTDVVLVMVAPRFGFAKVVAPVPARCLDDAVSAAVRVSGAEAGAKRRRRLSAGRVDLRLGCGDVERWVFRRRLRVGRRPPHDGDWARRTGGGAGGGGLGRGRAGRATPLRDPVLGCPASGRDDHAPARLASRRRRPARGERSRLRGGLRTARRPRRRAGGSGGRGGEPRALARDGARRPLPPRSTKRRLAAALGQRPRVRAGGRGARALRHWSSAR